MPIIDADKARTVFAIKRSKNPGFAGIDNELYFSDRTWMLFGDAKDVIGELVKQLAGGSRHALRSAPFRRCPFPLLELRMRSSLSWAAAALLSVAPAVQAQDACAENSKRRSAPGRNTRACSTRSRP